MTTAHTFEVWQLLGMAVFIALPFYAVGGLIERHRAEMKKMRS